MIRFIIITFFLFASMPILFAQAEEERTGAPYFELEDSSEQFFLIHHKVSVQIVGTIADVSITQEYLNKGAQPINATYLFPSGTKAAMYAMEMRLEDRIVHAEIMEKGAAKEIIVRVNEDGLVIGLVEQFRPNVFQTSLANIPAGEKVQVVLKYTEFVSAEANLYEFVVPHAVGPRCNIQKKPSKNLFLNISSEPSFKMDVVFNPVVDIKTVASPSHSLIISKEGKKTTILVEKIKDEEKGKDFVLNYRLLGEIIDEELVFEEGFNLGTNEMVVTAYKTPDIVQSQGGVGQTVTAEEIESLMSKNINGIAAITGSLGPSQENGYGMMGNRCSCIWEHISSYYIDGVQVSASMFFVSEMEQELIIKEGMPASMNDGEFNEKIDIRSFGNTRRSVSIGRLKYVPFLTMREDMNELSIISNQVF